MGKLPTAAHVRERLGFTLLKSLEALRCESLQFSARFKTDQRWRWIPTVKPHTRLVSRDRLLSYLSHKAWLLRVAVPLEGFLLIRYCVL